MTSFDPNTASSPDSGIFGLPGEEKGARLVFLPVPWEATTSYGSGASKAPAAILEASRQVDLFDHDVHKPYEPGLFLLPESAEVRAWNRRAKAAAQKVISTSRPLKKELALVNELSGKLNAWVQSQTARLLDQGKIVGVLGGDHSVPYGAIKAAAQRNPGMGLLHFDAHHDTRDSFEGFTHSHASIFHNVMKDIPAIKNLVQVGIRDFCEQEAEFCAAQGERVKVFYDADLARRKYSGQKWDSTCSDIVDALPEKVWVTFDIDGLDPRFCPNTGTPVPGGLDFNETNHLLGALARSGRTIVGFDLVEVSPGPKGSGEWDANVGARLLYKLAAWTLVSRKLCRPR